MPAARAAGSGSGVISRVKRGVPNSDARVKSRPEQPGQSGSASAAASVTT
jgi:hypothetical protein